MPLLGQKQTQTNKQTWPLPRVQLLKVNIFVCRYHGMILMVPDCDNFLDHLFFQFFQKKKSKTKTWPNLEQQWKKRAIANHQFKTNGFLALLKGNRFINRPNRRILHVNKQRVVSLLRVVVREKRAKC